MFCISMRGSFREHHSGCNRVAQPPPLEASAALPRSDDSQRSLLLGCKYKGPKHPMGSNQSDRASSSDHRWSFDGQQILSWPGSQAVSGESAQQTNEFGVTRALDRGVAQNPEG